MIQPRIEEVRAESGMSLDRKILYSYLRRIAGRPVNSGDIIESIERIGFVSSLGRSVVYRGQYGKVIVHYTKHNLLGKVMDKLVYITKR